MERFYFFFFNLNIKFFENSSVEMYFFIFHIKFTGNIRMVVQLSKLRYCQVDNILLQPLFPASKFLTSALGKPFINTRECKIPCFSKQLDHLLLLLVNVLSIYMRHHNLPKKSRFKVPLQEISLMIEFTCDATVLSLSFIKSEDKVRYPYFSPLVLLIGKYW